MRRESPTIGDVSLESGADEGGGGLVIADLAVAYRQKTVLQGVSARIERGQVIGIIGPN